MTELFNKCEVTFTGIKSPGWKDDVTFIPSDQAPPSAGTNDPSRSLCGDAVEANSRGDEAHHSEDESVETYPVCRGSFWRNLNHDRGRFTFGVEDNGGMAGTMTWVMRLYWDRWDTEVLYLQKGGGPMQFEGVRSRVVFVLILVLVLGIVGLGMDGDGYRGYNKQTNQALIISNRRLHQPNRPRSIPRCLS